MMRAHFQTQCIEAAQDFQSSCIPMDQWNHEKHLMVGWGLIWQKRRETNSSRLNPLDFEALFADFSRTLRRLNESHGVPNSETRGYHYTLTRCWLSVIAQIDPDHPDLSTWFKDPSCSGRNLLLQWYRAEELMSREARLGWVPPSIPYPHPLVYACR
ncbi:hypothetical protein GC167_09360 [bacterium]|nr:hypothetical protein [bacterium]